MKNRILEVLCLIALAVPFSICAEKLVILHTNDTHSQIDADKNGRGGVLQRKALIDSIRNAEENVILVDAGDVVQGSLFFKFFRGEVEYPLMDKMGYDIRILGNHEFDNGIADIAKYYRQTKGTPISANYDFTGTELDGIFSPYTIREIGGKRIGFLGINVNPEGLIASENIGNLKYNDLIKVANETAAYLKKKEKCDLVVAVTHIGIVKVAGQPTDYDLARESRDIDIIIGGHSHSEIFPGAEGDTPSIVPNAAGKPVLVAQTGKYGKYLGYIAIDLDRLKKSNARDYDYRLIPVTSRFPEEVLDKDIMEFLAPYHAKVDSINARVIARSVADFDNTDRSGAFGNFTADLAYDYASHKADSLRQALGSFPEVDFAIMNIGGIRMPMQKGDITEGQILNTYPFSNHLVIGTLKGADLIETMKIAGMKGGEAISSQLMVVFDKENPDDSKVYYKGYEIDPDREYTYATIDYLFAGNDFLTPLANSRLLWRDEVEVAAPILRYVESLGERNLPVDPDTRTRWKGME